MPQKLADAKIYIQIKPHIRSHNPGLSMGSLWASLGRYRRHAQFGRSSPRRLGAAGAALPLVFRGRRWSLDPGGEAAPWLGGKDAESQR